MKRKFLIVFYVALVVFLFSKIVSFLRSDESKIRGIIFLTKQAVEQEDVFKTLSYFSYAYSDRDGNNRANLFVIARHVFKTYSSIRIEITKINIEVSDKSKAVAHMNFVVQGSALAKGSAMSSLYTQKVTFDVYFRKEKGVWMVVEMKFIDPEDFLKQVQGL